MATKTSVTKGPRMSDEAVKAKTGKTWKEWFTILDKAGARKMTHQEIVKLLNTKHAVGPWWQQMVAVTYEQQSGLRQKHEKPGGFEISVSRTLNVAVAKLYKSFAEEKARTQWLPESGLVVRTANANKSMRITWNDGKTVLSLNFIPKGDRKTQVAVQHLKLPDAKSAAKMKTYWGKALDRLRDLFK